jgi:hypothetical protein
MAGTVAGHFARYHPRWPCHIPPDAERFVWFHMKSYKLKNPALARLKHVFQPISD